MTGQTDEQRASAMRRSIVLARIGIVAWVVVIVIAVVLASRLQPGWLWALLAAFGAVRVVMDVHRLRAAREALADLAEQRVRPRGSGP